MNCPFCHKQLSDSSQFCPMCGQEISFESGTADLDSFWDPVNRKSKEFEQECLDIAKLRAKEVKARQQKAILTIAALATVVAFIGLGINIFYVAIPKASLSKAEVGSYISLGEYEQDNNQSNGKEKIEWLTLAKEEDSILVISKYALDCRQYNASSWDETWEASDLRKWLNKSFFNEAFNPFEQEMILSKDVVAVSNPYFDISPGNDTTDKVFLLSVTEAKDYFSTDESRKCIPTEYTIKHGSTSAYSTAWWLRTPGYIRYMTYVNHDGSVSYEGMSIRSTSVAIRPAMWISLK